MEIVLCPMPDPCHEGVFLADPLGQFGKAVVARDYAESVDFPGTEHLHGIVCQGVIRGNRTLGVCKVEPVALDAFQPGVFTTFRYDLTPQGAVSGRKSLQASQTGGDRMIQFTLAYYAWDRDDAGPTRADLRRQQGVQESRLRMLRPLERNGIQPTAIL